MPAGKAEIEQYFSSVITMSEREDPITFWMEKEANYPLLSSYATDILCIPAPSAPVERTFSTAGESTSGRRNRLSDKNLEREVLLQKNRQYLWIITRWMHDIVGRAWASVRAERGAVACVIRMQLKLRPQNIPKVHIVNYNDTLPHAQN